MQLLSYCQCNFFHNIITQKKTDSLSACTQMDTSSDIGDNSFSFNEQDEFDSIAGMVDVTDATKTYLLAEKFGNTHFKEFQKKAIDAILNKQNCLVIQLTGKSKSLCYHYIWVKPAWL